MQGVYDNAVAAARKFFWPCTAVIGLSDILIEEVPIEPSNLGAENSNESLGDDASKAESKEEGEEGEEAAAAPPMQKIEVPILRYVATSHPDARSIENSVLRYEMQGVTGRVLQTGEPVLVPHVSAEDHIHFLHGRMRSPHVKIYGSYCAVPLKDNVTGEVYGVLAIDTLLDGRVLLQQHLECLHEIALTMELAREPHAQKERERKERERREAEQRAAEEAARKAAEEEEERLRREQEAAEARDGDGAE